MFRVVQATKIVQNLFLQRNNTINHVKQTYRNGHAHAAFYRKGGAPPSKTTIICAELTGGFMWWWILWHLWHEYKHITGEWEYPDVTRWTNAELGIPPDDYEE